jgi:hypothetical protein
MFWNPTTHMACGVPYATAVDGIIDGIRDARTDFGIQCVLIAAINRAEDQLDRGKGVDFDDFAAAMRKKIAAQ